MDHVCPNLLWRGDLPVVPAMHETPHIRQHMPMLITAATCHVLVVSCAATYWCWCHESFQHMNKCAPTSVGTGIVVCMLETQQDICPWIGAGTRGNQQHLQIRYRRVHDHEHKHAHVRVSAYNMYSPTRALMHTCCISQHANALRFSWRPPPVELFTNLMPHGSRPSTHFMSSNTTRVYTSMHVEAHLQLALGHVRVEASAHAYLRFRSCLVDTQFVHV
jgi:hypothetical protein